MNEHDVAELSPRTATDAAAAAEASTVPDATTVEIVENTGGSLAYLVIVVASTWTSLQGQKLELTFNLKDTAGSGATFAPGTGQVLDGPILWVPDAPVLWNIDSNTGSQLVMQQTNSNGGPGNQVFDFRVVVEIDGEKFYSADPSIINSPVGG